MDIRVIATSKDLFDQMRSRKINRTNVYSFFPIDRGNCACAAMIREWKDKLMLLPSNKREETMKKTENLVCPRDKSGMQRFVVSCKNCGEVQGYCWAKDARLKDWCDFHYVSWTDGIEWHGCFTPNISPVDESLTLECVCGQDTRDFRANQTLSPNKAFELEKANRIGRDFNQEKSKFAVAFV